MLKVAAFFSELKKCIRNYVLRIGYRGYKCKVEEKKGAEEAGEAYLKRVRVI